MAIRVLEFFDDLKKFTAETAIATSRLPHLSVTSSIVSGLRVTPAFCSD